MKRIIPLIIAAIVCAILFTAYFMLRDGDGKSDPGKEQAVEELIDINEPDKITSISIKNGDQTLSFHRISDGWELLEDTGIPVDGGAVDRTAKALQHILCIRRISENQENLAEYGLDQPKISLTFTCSGENKYYYFGDLSNFYGGYYFRMSGSESVYIIDSELYASLDHEIDDFLSVDILPTINEDSKLTFTDLKGNTSDPSADQTFFDLLFSLETDRYVDFGESNFGIYGLDFPALLTIDGGDRIRLSVGETDEFIYMLINDSNMIYLAKCEDNEKLAGYIKGSAAGAGE